MDVYCMPRHSMINNISVTQCESSTSYTAQTDLIGQQQWETYTRLRIQHTAHGYNTNLATGTLIPCALLALFDERTKILGSL